DDEAVHDLPRRSHRGGVRAGQRRRENVVHHADHGGERLARAAAEVPTPVGKRRRLAVANEPLVRGDADEYEAPEIDLQTRPLESASGRKTERGCFYGSNLHLDLPLSSAGPMLAAVANLSNKFFS